MSNISRARALELILFDLNDLVNPLLWYPATAGLEETCFYIRFTNSGPNYIYVSFDRGVTTHEIIPPEDYIELYFQNNASYSQKTNGLPKGMPIHLRGTGTNNEFYISSYTYVE